jgi:hypothetical protein
MNLYLFVCVPWHCMTFWKERIPWANSFHYITDTNLHKMSLVVEVKYTGMYGIFFCLIFWMLSALPVLQATLFQIKNNRLLVRCHAVAGGVEVWMYLFLTLAIDGAGGQHYAPAPVPLGNSSSIHCMGGLVGPRTGLSCSHCSSVPELT